MSLPPVEPDNDNPETWAVAVRITGGTSTTRKYLIGGQNSRYGITLFESEKHALQYIGDSRIDGFPVRYTKEMQI